MPQHFDPPTTFSDGYTQMSPTLHPNDQDVTLVHNDLNVSPITQVVDDVHRDTVAKSMLSANVSLLSISTTSSFVAVNVSDLHTPDVHLSPEDDQPSTVRKGTSPLLSTTISSIRRIGDELDAILQTPPPVLHRQDAMLPGQSVLAVDNVAPKAPTASASAYPTVRSQNVSEALIYKRLEDYQRERERSFENREAQRQFEFCHGIAIES